MREKIDISDRDNKIVSFIEPSEKVKQITFETRTTYSKVGDNKSTDTKYTDPNQIIVHTAITLNTPFNIPEALKPLIELWAKNKTRKIRKLESRYARKTKESLEKK